MNYNNYRNMTAAQRAAWTQAYREFVSAQLPTIRNAKQSSKELVEMMNKGLDLLTAFPFTRSFVSETRSFNSHFRVRTTFIRYCDKVTKEVQGTFGETVDLTDKSLLTPHVGRPTKDEAQARALAAERARQEREKNENTLFGKMGDIPDDNTIVEGTVSGNMTGGVGFHLDQLKWLMSDNLKEAVDTIRELRNAAAEAATTAKTLAMEKASEDRIAVYAKEAAEKTEAYERIYEQVDNEIARVYVRLKEDSTYIEEMKNKGTDPDALRTALRPYWDKVENKEVFKQQVIEDIKANDPEQAKKREAEEKKTKRKNEIIKYLTRKDKANTAKRAKGMRERYTELIALIGEEEAKPYLPLVEKAEEDAAGKTDNPDSNGDSDNSDNSESGNYGITGNAGKSGENVE
jgi:hypothetical protein